MAWLMVRTALPISSSAGVLSPSRHYSSNYDEQNRVPLLDSRVSGKPSVVKMRSRAQIVAVFAEDGYCFLEFGIIQFLWTVVAFQLHMFRGPQSPKRKSNTVLPGDISQAFYEHILAFIKPVIKITPPNNKIASRGFVEHTLERSLQLRIHCYPTNNPTRRVSKYNAYNIKKHIIG
ncbi:hypothetical protein ACTXT7_007947 [Hymenolepis weldensis]